MNPLISSVAIVGTVSVLGCGIVTAEPASSLDAASADAALVGSFGDAGDAGIQPTVPDSGPTLAQLCASACETLDREQSCFSDCENYVSEPAPKCVAQCRNRCLHPSEFAAGPCAGAYYYFVDCLTEGGVTYCNSRGFETYRTDATCEDQAVVLRMCLATQTRDASSDGAPGARP